MSESEKNKKQTLYVFKPVLSYTLVHIMFQVIIKYL